MASSKGLPDEYVDDDLDEVEDIEAYCVRCKQKTYMENPLPVWTKRGTPGTRGVCEICGTTTFRMGMTDAHRHLTKPDMDEILPQSGEAPRKGINAQYTTYINHSPDDREFAARLAEDLTKMGIPSYATPEERGDINWAGGIHPALAESKNMIVVLSDKGAKEDKVESSWTLFKQQRKSIVVALVNEVEVPDDLRRSPRYDFSDNYKAAFRQMIQTLVS